jgi:hypothetical protein
MRQRSIVLAFVLGFVAHAVAQDEPKPPSKVSAAQANLPALTAASVTENATQTAAELATTIDQDPRAKTAASSILQPIYIVAEQLAFPAFHWLAFGLMTAGVVSFTLQLVFGKLAVLLRMGFSWGAILSDAFGFVISVFGLVLTTQAATENSTFTHSAAAVLSATIAGAFVGIILYRWGQAQELQAAQGRAQSTP